MAIRYVDSILGTDSGSAATPGSGAWKSLQYAFNNLTSGDTLSINGTFKDATIDSGGSAGNYIWQFQAAKSFTLVSTTPYSGIIVASAAYMLLFYSSFATSTFTLGDVVFAGSANGGQRIDKGIVFNTTTACTFNTVAGRPPKFIETPSTALISFNVGSGSNILATLNDFIVDTPATEDQTAGGGVFIFAPSGANGLASGASVIVNRPVINVRNARHGNSDGNLNAFIALACSNSSAIVQINDPVINIATSGTNVSQMVAARIVNSNNARIGGGTFNLTSTTAAASWVGPQIDCDSGSLTCTNAVMENNQIYIDSLGGGILCAIGHDTTSAGDGRISNAIQRNNIAVGSDNFAAGGGHGIFAGYCVNSFQTGNSATNVDLGCLMKGCTNTVGSRNKVRNARSTYLYNKGSTSCTYAGNTIYMGNTGGGGVGMQASVNGATNVATSKFTGNIIQLVGTIGEVIRNDASQDCTYSSSHYYDAGYVVPNPIANNGATNYTTLATAIAALDPNAVVSTGFAPIPATSPRYSITPSTTIPVNIF